MGFLSSFLGLIGASAVFVGADVKERWDEIDRERQRIAANPAPPPEMRGNLRDKYESEWHRGDNTHFPEERAIQRCFTGGLSFLQSVR